ncbi:MAG: hypothetical protein Q9187_001909 [Circinaria calcarea]
MEFVDGVNTGPTLENPCLFGEGGQDSAARRTGGFAAEVENPGKSAYTTSPPTKAESTSKRSLLPGGQLWGMVSGEQKKDYFHAEVESPEMGQSSRPPKKQTKR